MSRDVIITPASGNVDFLNFSSSKAQITLTTANNLVISNPGGELSIGDTASNVFIGDGVNTVDIVFEQNGAIRALAGKTITLGQSTSSISFASNVTSNLSALALNINGYGQVIAANGVWIGPQTNLGGSQGVQGAQGVQGQVGSQGSTGNKGGVRYNWSSTVTDADPGTGNIRYNNATIGSVTQLFISNTDINSIATNGWLDTWDDSTTTGSRGYVVINGNAAGSTVTNIFLVNGAITGAANYVKVPVSHISGSIPTNLDPLIVSFARTGNVGAQGAVGSQGPQGFQGHQGVQGLVGAQGPIGSGAQGIQGAQGVQGQGGSQGAQGHQGFQGHQGVQGLVGAQGATGTGAQGFQGHQGVQGLVGAQGAPGVGNVSGTQNYVAKFTAATTLGNSQIFDNGTNVGIGTTSPYSQLHLTGATTVGSGTSARPAFKPTNWGYSASYRVLQIGSASTDYTTTNTGAVTVALNYDPSANPNSSFTGDGSEILFRRGTKFLTPNAADNAYNNNLTLLDGNAGIGTTSPATPLHVVGGPTGTAGWNRTATLQATYPVLTFNSNNSKWAGIGYDAGDALSFWVNAGTSDVTAGTEALTITNGGNVTIAGSVGIGSTSPAYRLDVVGTGNQYIRAMSTVDTGYSGLIISNSATSGKTWEIGVGGNAVTSTYANKLYFYVDAAPRVTFTADGNVGIGTSSPSSKLHVSNAAAATRITITDDVTNGRSGYIESNYSDALVIGTTSGVRSIRFAPDNTTRMFIDVGGNVGIATTIPATRLHVITGDTAEGEVRIQNNSVAHSSGINFYTSPTGQRGFVGWRGTSSTAPYASSGMYLINFDNSPIIFGTATNAEKVRIQDNGNVGIGTTNATYKLQVAGTIFSSTGGFRFPDGTTQTTAAAGTASGTTNYVAKFTGTSSLGNSQIFDNGTNVGIGTTSPQSKLEVATSSGNFSHFGATSTTNGEFTGITLGYRENNSNYRKAAIVQEQIGDNAARGHLHLLVDIANDAGSVVLGDSKLMIHGTTGNVGIGTTNPGYKLDVNGNSMFRDTMYFGSGGFISWTSGLNDGTTQTFYSPASGSLGFYSNSSLAMFIKSNQNVGIGTTNPQYKLVVSNAGGIGGEFDPTGVQIGGGFGIQAYNRATSAYVPLQLYASAIYLNGGNVGVGTTSPASKLDIYPGATNLGVGANGVRVQRPNSYGQYGYLEYLIGSDTTVLGSLYTGGGASAFGQIYFRQHSSTTSRDSMVIRGDGNVGIGTTNPTYNLHVIGTFNASSTITQNGTAVVTNNGGSWNINSASSNLLTSLDDRTISPSEQTASRLGFGFTSWNNNNTSPYADFLHLRSYADSSGGSDNLVMFRKDAIGMRIWQQTYGSGTAYASYKDVAWTDGTNSSGTWGISITGNAATATSVHFNNLTNKTSGTGTYATSGSFNVSGSQTFSTSTPGTTTYQLNFTGQATADYAQGITWGWSSSGAQAGIYVQSSGSYGTKMYFATTDNFTTGAKNKLMIQHDGAMLMYSGVALGSNAWGGSTANEAGRVLFPAGAAGSWDNAQTGAIKIRLPFRANNSMWRFTVKIYDYNNQFVADYNIGNYSYSAGGYQVAASYMGSSNAQARTVRWGNDGTYDCVWIGETDTVWYYPIVTVTDFESGFRTSSGLNGSNNWDVSIVTSFGTVAYSQTPSSRFASGSNIDGNLIWHAGNDGSGSGLDADTLDGINSSGFVQQNGTYTLASGYSVAMGDWGLRNTTPYGWIQFGPANSSHAHIYTDRSNFYFNAQIQVNGGSQINTSDIRASTYYDTSGTSYYLDLDSITSLRTVGSWRSDSSTWDGEFSGKIQYHSSYWYFQAANGWLFRNSGGTNVVTFDSSGNTSAAGYVRAGTNVYTDANYGYGLVGVYASTRYQGVFAMGDSYKLPADGTSAGNLYGIAWSYPSAGGVAGNLDSHGMLVLINGGFGSCMSYSIKASGNITAYSDERLKTDWREMPENFVENLANVKVGIYKRIDREQITQVGVSAQSLQKVLPEAVTEATDEMKTLSVSYGNAALAAAVELAKEIVLLKKEIEELKTKIKG